MFVSIEPQDGEKFGNTVDLSVQFNEAVKLDFSKKNILENIRISDADQTAHGKQMRRALHRLESMPVHDKDELEAEAGAWMAFETHKQVDLFVRAARSAGQSDEDMAKFVPRDLATQDNVALFEKYEMPDLANVIRASMRPK